MIAPVRPVPDRAPELQVLFAEARRRRRRRRLAAAAVSLAAVGGIVAGMLAGGGRSDPPRPAAARHRPVPGAGHAPALTLPAARVSWVDYQNRLHVGNIASGAQRVMATLPAEGDGWLIRAGGDLYWPSSSGPARILGYDLAARRLLRPVPGQSAFTSAGGRYLYVRQAATRLLERSAEPSGPARVLRVPAGWSVSATSWEGTAAGGIIVYSGAPGRAVRAGIWNPRTGRVRALGTDYLINDIYTAKGGRFSLIAWQPAACAAGDCQLMITNTAARQAVPVRSPLGHGFTAADARFSPDGTQLAAFARRASLSSAGANDSELALIRTGTGRLRLDRAARLVTTEDAGWLLWLPGGRRLLAGALASSYAVDTVTLAARPFFFDRGTPDHDIMDTPDINFSAVLVPGGRHRGGLAASNGSVPRPR